jgi:hypothetical protein
MIAGGERRLATRTTFERNLFANRLIGCVVIAARPTNFRPPENDEDGRDDGRGLTQLRELKTQLFALKPFP